VAGLSGRPGREPGEPGQPGQQQAPEAVIADLQRRSQFALGGAFVVLIGAVIAFALHARAVGIVLLVLMLLGGMASFYFSVMFRNRAVAQARAARQEQAARVAATRKPNHPRS
jgi:uncharacterized membrane-anchored protein